MLKNLRTAISDVMERMFFLLPAPEEVIPDDNEGYSVSIGITGTPRYYIELTFNRLLARTMTASALGIPEDGVDEEIAVQCLLETANIIAGVFLLGWGRESTRDITFPVVGNEAVFGSFVPLEQARLIMQFSGMTLAARLDSVSESERNANHREVRYCSGG